MASSGTSGTSVAKKVSTCFLKRSFEGVEQTSCSAGYEIGGQGVFFDIRHVGLIFNNRNLLSAKLSSAKNLKSMHRKN